MGLLKQSEGSSHLLQTSHFTAFAGRGKIRVGSDIIDQYEEINSGRITLETTTPTTVRYLSTDSGESNSDQEGRRFRRDASFPDGAVFDTFNNYVPFGNRGPTPLATFTESNFDFDDGVYTAPYSGTFFFLFHGPVGNEQSITVDLRKNSVSFVEMTITYGGSGAIPVILSLEAGDRVDMELSETSRIRAKFTAVFNAFDLQRKLNTVSSKMDMQS